MHSPTTVYFEHKPGHIDPDTDFGRDFLKEGEAYFQSVKYFLNLLRIVYKMMHIQSSSFILLMSIRTQEAKK